MNASVRIECFHRVVADADVEREWPYIVRESAMSQSAFRAKLALLGRTHTFVDEVQATRILSGQDAGPTNPCWVTFDDGYRDNLIYAADVLDEFGIRPTLFLTTSVLKPRWMLPVDRWYAVLQSAKRSRGSLPGTSDSWSFDLSLQEHRERLVLGPEKRRFVTAGPPEQQALLQRLASALDGDLTARPDYLDARDLATLRARGWAIGPHGHEHRLLTACSDDELQREVMKSVEQLETAGILSSRWYAYADGAFDARSKRAVASILGPRGFHGAVTIEGANADVGADAWRVPRFISVPDAAEAPSANIDQTWPNPADQRTARTLATARPDWNGPT